MRWFSSAPAEAKASASAASGEDTLFDEAFQRQLESLALAARKLVQGRDRAERRTRRAGHGIELADYRSYSPGDDYRHIDWNAYARTERLLLRLFEQEEDLGVSLLLDCSASMGASATSGALSTGASATSGALSKLARGKQLAAALAYVALSGLDRVSIHALGVDELARMPAARGKAQIFTALEFLRRLKPEGPTDLGSAVAKFIARQKRRGLVVLISDLYDPQGVEHAISALRYARFELHVIRVLDGAEAEPALRGDVELIDAETGLSRTVTITPALLARYRAAFAAHRTRIEAFCREKHVPLHTVTTGEALDTATLRVLRRGGLLE
jgi:uncharacterized protein (DUF58 family)